MKKIKIGITVALALLTSISSFAQIDLGIQYYRLGDYQKAQKYLEKDFNSNPSEANFYLGEIAFAEGNVTKAEEYYNNGLKTNAENIYNQIGLTKLKLKSDPKAAEAAFSAIIKKKNNADIFVAIGYAYLDNKMIDKATEWATDAKGLDSKNANAYILEGDIVAFNNDVKKYGEAAGKYEMAIHFAPDYGLGYVKTAKIYEHVNFKLAIEKLKTIIEKHPNYIIAYGYLGKVYTQNGFYEQAIEMYKTYFQSGVYSVEDIEFYARVLYFTDNFTDSKKLVDEGLQKEPDHFVLNRFLMYIYAKTKDANEGLKAAHKFFSLKDSSKYIAEDYKMYASLLKDAKRYDEAFANYNKAINMEPDKMASYTDAAAAARDIKDYARAAGYVKQQMTKKAESSNNPDHKHEVIDVNTLGYDYYSAGATIAKNTALVETLMKNKDVINELMLANKSLIADSLTKSPNYFARNYALYYLYKADSTFATLIQLIPESYSGYRFMALTKHAINPDTEAGEAKPYYEKVVEIVTKDKTEFTASEKRVLLEAYNYLGYYYYLKLDKPNTILYWNKVLEIDPENKNAKLVLEEMNKEPKK